MDDFRCDTEQIIVFAFDNLQFPSPLFGLLCFLSVSPIQAPQFCLGFRILVLLWVESVKFGLKVLNRRSDVGLILLLFPPLFRLRLKPV